MQYFSDLLPGEHFQIRSYVKGVGKCAFFSGKLAIYLKRREIRPKLLVITNRKWHIGFQMK